MFAVAAIANESMSSGRVSLLQILSFIINMK